MKPLFLRCFLWFFTRISYRLMPLSSDHVPSRGGALLVSNHLSVVDMLLILASTHRFIRFMLPEEICELVWLKPFLKYLRVIPLPPEQRPRDLAKALEQAREAIRSGEIVGIFAERSISRLGVMQQFRDELERIMEGLDAPVIPVCLDGVWGSIFSYHGGRFFWKLPRNLGYPVTISFGKPLPSSVKAHEVRTAVQELNTEAWPQRRHSMKLLHRSFIQRARRCPFRFAMADSRTPRLSFGGALAKTIYLAGRLRSHWSGQEMVGILIPPSVGGALVNFAALMLGKVPVNLNYTLSEESLAECCRQCGLQTILTSQQVLDRLKMNLPGRILLIESLAGAPRWFEKVRALSLAWLAPVRLLEAAVGRDKPGSLDDLATVIFSSGSTGEPKGIMLSHYNLASNSEQLGQAFDLGPEDRFLGLLPFFHSFGFNATLVAPALAGVGVVFHGNPLEAKAVGDLARRYRVTYLMGTPSFLQLYVRGCQPGDFGSLRLAMAGAEKLPEWLATAFEDKFGLRPVEGYGCTECSPVISVNTRDFRGPGLRQAGSRRGTIGRPLPGISIRIVDQETYEPLPPNQPGLLLVRGPNVMRGYLGRPDKTQEVFREGWYITGDIAMVNEDGFMQITDRLSRFSKLGGEMVPHVKVEDSLHEAAGVTEITFAVTGVPDPSKGERLVVLHTLTEERLAELLKKLPQLGLPNLWVPRANQFFRVESLPRLATGKMDLRKIKELALGFSKSAQAAPVAQPA